MNERIAIRRSFSRAAASYNQHAMLQNAVADTLIALCTPYLPKSGADILDAGCGTGYIARQLPEHLVVQIDSAESMTKAAAENNHPTLCADMEQLPFADNMFEGYLSSLSLQWVRHRTHVFREAHRILKPGSMMGISTLGPGTLIELRNAYRDASLPEHVLDFIPPEHIEGELKQAGFRLLVVKEEKRMLHFETAQEVLQHLKGLGATYKAHGGGLSGKQYLAQLQQRLAAQAEDGQIPLSFRVCYFLLEAC